MNQLIKTLIWTYAALILLEGALRKWVFPAQSELLLIIRDPVLLLIIGLAAIKGTLRMNKFMIAIMILAVASIISSVLGGCNNLIVMAYGLRINFLHLPLIWIIAEHFDRRDVERLGIFYLLCAIPIVLLMIQQFRSGPLDWINKGVGLDEGGQIFGAEGRIRPPGPFAFITGPQIYFPLCAALLLGQIGTKHRFQIPLLIISGSAILIALPISISRTVMLGTAIVGLVYLATLLITGRSASKIIKPVVILGFVAILALQLPIFDDAFRVFGTRWTEAAASTEGSAWEDVISRTLQTFTNPIDYAMNAQTFGQGIGMGSNVAARLMQGSMGFMLAEEEYAKIYMELGFVVGTGFILLRLSLFVYLLMAAWHLLRKEHRALPLLILSAVSTVIIFGQWAPPTILGFCVLGSGLVLAACKTPKDEIALEADEAPDRPPEANHDRHAGNRLPGISKTGFHSPVISTKETRT